MRTGQRKLHQIPLHIDSYIVTIHKSQQSMRKKAENDWYASQGSSRISMPNKNTHKREINLG